MATDRDEIDSLPEDSIEACINKSMRWDKDGDFEAAHRVETKALHLLVRALRQGEDCARVAAAAEMIDVALQRKSRGARWFA